MAELLLRKREMSDRPASWSDQKWAARPRRGDVVDVRPDGFYGIWATNQIGRGWDRAAFMLVTVADAAELTNLRGHKSDMDKARPKNRYGIEAWADLPWTITSRTLPDGRTLDEWYAAPSSGITMTDRLA